MQENISQALIAKKCVDLNLIHRWNCVARDSINSTGLDDDKALVKQFWPAVMQQLDFITRDKSGINGWRFVCPIFDQWKWVAPPTEHESSRGWQCVPLRDVSCPLKAREDLQIWQNPHMGTKS